MRWHGSSTSGPRKQNEGGSGKGPPPAHLAAALQLLGDQLIELLRTAATVGHPAPLCPRLALARPSQLRSGSRAALAALGDLNK